MNRPDWRPELSHLLGVTLEELEEPRNILWKNYEERHTKLAKSVADFYETGGVSTISPVDVSGV